MAINERGRGFTLIELLVVISIIAILASIIVVGIGRLHIYSYTQKVKSFCEGASQGCLDFRTKYKRNPYGAPEECDTLNEKMSSQHGWFELCPTDVSHPKTGNKLTGIIDINKQRMVFLAIYPDFIGPGNTVIDCWEGTIQSQYNWHNDKTVFWSAGYDKTFEFSPGDGSPSPYIYTKQEKEAGVGKQMNKDALETDIVSTF
jgi:prepilin-type N-terminal cleavage/methylation domain-containing protein